MWRTANSNAQEVMHIPKITDDKLLMEVGHKLIKKLCGRVGEKNVINIDK